MPETGTGFLVDPTGHEPMALDEEDYERIRQYLHVRHSANDETCEAIDWLLHLSTEHTGMDDEEIFIWTGIICPTRTETTSVVFWPVG